MKLKLLVSIAGADFSFSPGDVTEVFSGDEARRLIDAGFAVPFAEDPVETAVRRPAKERRG